MRDLFVAVVLATTCAIQASPAASASLAQAATAPTEAEALALVKAYSPSDLRLEGETRVLRETFVPTLRKDPNFARLLEVFPTLGDEIVNAMIPHMPVYIEEFDQRFFPRAAALVRSSLSAEDVRSLIAFYRSPLGQKMIRAGAARVDGKAIAEKGLSTGVVEQSDLDRQALQTGFAIYGELTPKEREEFMTYAGSPPGRRFLALRPQLTAIGLELINDPGPRFKALTEKAMLDTMSRVTGVDLSNRK